MSHYRPFAFVSASLLSLVAVAGGKKPVFVNYDDTHFMHSRDRFGLKVDEAEIRSLVRQYEGTDVSDLLFCIGGRIADVPNKAKESWIDKYRQTNENGIAVCYTNAYGPRMAHELYEVRKIDPYALWIDESRKVGIRPWLSFRLNDCHANWEKAGVLHPNFIHDHPEYRRVRHREPMGYFDRCLDFEIEAVRARELAFIGEMLERYDVDGVELDWQREIYCFVPGRESVATANGFQRAVRRLADAAAKRRGHPVKVMARVPADPDTALRFGFDVAAWADEKLVDVLVPCPRWDVTDNELPIDLWKRLLRKSDVLLAPGVELRMRNPDGKPSYVTPPQLLGAASAFYSQGADALYLFNYFDDPDWKFHPGDAHRCYWTAFGRPEDDKAVCWRNQLVWLKMIGSPDKVFAASRDHMLTFRDIAPLWGGVRAALPTEIAAGAQRYLRLVTGKVPSAARLTLRIGVKDGVAPKAVFVNSRPCTYRENAVCVPPLTKDPLLCYDVTAYPEENALVEIVAEKAMMVTHLDLQVRPAERPVLSSEGFNVFNIAPFQPGSEEQLAQEMIEYRERTGNDVVLYSLTLNPEGFPAMKKAAYLIDSYRKLRTALKGSGVKLGVLMQATLGHWPRVDKDEEPWMRSITIEGKTKRFCPLDPGYAAYIREVVTLLAKEEPCFLLIDDDVHASGSFGVECFCERHVARFNRENGTTYTPDALRAAVSASKPGDKLCCAFEKMQRDFVNDVVDTIRGALDAVDAKIPGGACMPYREHRYAGGTARRMAAKGQPAVLRIDNSLYGHRTLTTFAGSVAYTLALTDYYRDIPYLLDESDSCPHNRWALSATLLDMKFQAAAFAGLNGSKLWYCNAHKGRFPISRAYTDRLAEHRGLYGAIVKAVADAPIVGPVVPVTGGREAWHPSMTFENFVGDGDWATSMAARFGIPFACKCDLSADGLYLLGGSETVGKLTDDEIRSVLRRRALVDAPAAEALVARGFGKLIGVNVEKKDLRYNSERDLKDGSVYPFSKREETPLLTPLAKDAVVLTHLCYSPYYGSPDVETVAPASVLSTNELGGRVLVTAFPAAGFPPWVAPWTDMRKDWFLRLLGHLGWNGWSALADQDLLLLERRAKSGQTLLALFNTSFDPLDAVKLHAPTKVAAVEALSADGAWQPVAWHQDAAVLTIEMPLACANARILRVTAGDSAHRADCVRIGD